MTSTIKHHYVSAILRLGKLKARVKETDKTIQRDNDIKYNYD